MANFAPAGIVRIGRVPFDNSYAHTMTFANASSQASYFSSVCTQALEDGSYTYVRMNNSIKVAFNAERLYTYNYVMYQNRNYGGKWFYAFITGVNYVNERTTELVLELDVMQTWYFDYTLEECFVEREHVNDDTIGAHINPEPGMSMEYVYHSFAREPFEPEWLVLMVNQYPYYNVQQTEVMGSSPVSGGLYQGQYSACRYIVYDLSNPERIHQDIDAFNGSGCAETICDSFTASTQQIYLNDLEPLTVKAAEGDATKISGVYQLKEGTSVHTVSRKLNRPGNLDGYVPRNNKLYTYPYMYAEVGDYNGATTDFRFEFAGTDGIILDIDSPASPEGAAYVTARAYNGLEAHQKSALPFVANVANKVPWVYSAYQNWGAQNAVTNQLSVMGGVMNATFGMIPGMSKAAGALGGGKRSDLGKGLYQAGEGGSGGIEQVLGVVATNDRMSKVPNTAMGNTNGNAKLQNGYQGFYYSTKTLRYEFAQIADNFLTMYGYAVDRLKVPNRTGRRNWNYVKCANCDFHGRVPASHMALINQIYQSGITFWHTSDIGNYSLDNSIV